MIQPVFKNGHKIKIPINHDGGGVKCIEDISLIVHPFSYNC